MRTPMPFLHDITTGQRILQTTWPAHGILSVVAVILLFSPGCNSSRTQPETKTAPENTLHTETERGPVRVEIDITPEEPRLSDEPKLTVTVTAADGVKVELPPFGESLGDFVIRDFHEPLPRMSDGKQILQQEYTLEPTFAGSMSIDPLTIRFTDERADGDGREHEIQTEALLLEVGTMIASEAPSLNDLRPAESPVEVKNKTEVSNVVLVAACLAGLVFIILLIRRLRHRKQKQEPQLTPQQLAWRELNDLLGSRLSETDVKEFFVQLTAVVRRYIERTTGVNAPDQTTEEFLREVNQQKLFADEENLRLEAFLESADLVKFAGYQPDPESIKQSTQRAKQFLELKAVSETDMPVAVEAMS